MERAPVVVVRVWAARPSATAARLVGTLLVPGMDIARDFQRRFIDDLPSALQCDRRCRRRKGRSRRLRRSEEHTSELQSLMRISYAVFCLKTKKTQLDTYRVDSMTKKLL